MVYLKWKEGDMRRKRKKEATKMEREFFLDAIVFARMKHVNQFRKDGRTPYVTHLLRVAKSLEAIFGVRDLKVLAAAVLHDTIEDTTTDYDDLEERFGSEVADLVGWLTKDKRLPEKMREAVYLKALRKAPVEAKFIKLADVYDNLCVFRCF